MDARSRYGCLGKTLQDDKVTHLSPDHSYNESDTEHLAANTHSWDLFMSKQRSLFFLFCLFFYEDSAAQPLPNWDTREIDILENMSK